LASPYIACFLSVLVFFFGSAVVTEIIEELVVFGSGTKAIAISRFCIQKAFSNKEIGVGFEIMEDKDMERLSIISDWKRSHKVEIWP
jgi:hypothetical protein